MIARSVLLFRQNIAFFASICVVLTAIGVIGSQGLIQIPGGASAAIDIIIAYYVQRAVLYNVSLSARDKSVIQAKASPSFKYFLKYFFMLMIAAIPILFIIYFYIDLPREVVSLFVIAALVITFPLVQALFGTWLPAEITKVDTGLATAFSRGKVRFFRTYGIYFLVMFFLFFFTMVVSIVLSPIIEAAAPLTARSLIPDILLNFLIAGARLVGVTMMSVLATLIYLQSTPHFPRASAVIAGQAEPQ